MAKVIELSGPPGVGKTTLYREISIRWKKKFSWIPGHYLCPHPNFSFQYILLVFSIARQKMKGKKVGVFDEVKTAARNRFVAQYQAYIDVCWNDILSKQKNSYNGWDLRLHKAQQLAEVIEIFQLLRESEIDKFALMEEGLIHLIDVLNFSDTPEDIIKTIDVMPLPDALINIRADLFENVKRLTHREKCITIHRSLNVQQLEQITRKSQERRTIINEILQNKGIPILNIDSQEEIKTNADKIISFIEALN